MISHFISHQKNLQFYPCSKLFEDVWETPYNASDANTVMVHIRHLRKKLSDIDSSETFIDTAWGVGYKIAL